MGSNSGRGLVGASVKADASGGSCRMSVAAAFDTTSAGGGIVLSAAASRAAAIPDSGGLDTSIAWLLASTEKVPQPPTARPRVTKLPPAHPDAHAKHNHTLDLP